MTGTTFWPRARLEARMFFRSGAPWLVALLFVAMSLAAIVNGAVIAGQHKHVAEGAVHEQAERYAALVRDLERLEQQRASASVPLARLRPGLPSPSAVEAQLQTVRIAVPALPVTLLSPGSLQSFPQRYEIRGGSGARFWPFGRTIGDKILSGFSPEPPTENPSAIILGTFDLAFVTIYVYPLLIVVLTCNIVSADRDAGLLALTAAQPIAFRRWLVGRALIRGAIVVPSVVLPVVAAAVLMPEWSSMTLLRLGVWLAGSLVYCALWFVIAIVISLRTESTAASAMVSVVVWLAAVIVIPALLVIAQPLLAPASTRLAFVNEERAASLDLNPRVDAAIAALNQQVRHLQKSASSPEGDHPSFTVPITPAVGADLLSALGPEIWQGPMPAVHLSRGFAVARRVMTEQRLAPVLRQLAEQERREAGFYAWARFASPALLLQSLFDDAAGTSRARRERLLAQVDDHVRERDAFFTQRILANRNITADDLNHLMPFAYREEDASSFVARIVPPFAALLMACACSIWAAAASSRRWTS
jgi:ABC-2 type transport system permease protein